MQEQQLSQEEPGPYIIKTIDLLGSKRKEEREEAEQSLQQMGPEAIESLLSLLRQEAQKRKRRRNLVLTGFACYLVIAAVLSLVFHARGAFKDIGGITVMMMVIAFAVSKRQKNATRELAKHEDK